MAVTIIFFLSLFFTLLFTFCIIGEFYEKLAKKGVDIIIFLLIVSALWSYFYYLSNL